MFNIRSWFSKPKAPTPQKRYAAAQLSRYVDFFTSLLVAHRERIRDLPKLRAHSRELRNDNAYASRFMELVSTNLVGPEGINFESEIMGNKNKPKENWNLAIEGAFSEWGKSCTVDGRLGWIEVQQLIAETVATDGEILIRRVKGYPNAFGYALELIDADRLDYQFNQVLKGGMRIIGGVEMDAWGRRLAYHLWTSHPDDWEATPKRTRIPADQILHVYREDRTQGVRGIPWMTPCMVQLNMLGRLWTAELSAANAEADRLGIIKSMSGIDPKELDGDNGVTAAELTSDHATFMGLDAGQDIVFPPSIHPNSVLPAFTSYLLKGVASGLGVAYHSLSGDLSESKFSSDRTALIQERDHWRKLQSWFIRSVCDPIFRDWLEMAILSGALPSLGIDIERLYAPRWAARSWDWVDPEKDINASVTAIERGLSTYQRELSQQGIDWRDLFDQRALEQEYAKGIGLNLDGPTKTAATATFKEDPNGSQISTDPAA